MDLGYARIYVNVDNLQNGTCFLCVLAMYECKYIIVYEGTFALEFCYDVLELLEKSKYDIIDFTIKLDY